MNSSEVENLYAWAQKIIRLEPRIHTCKRFRQFREWQMDLGLMNFLEDYWPIETALHLIIYDKDNIGRWPHSLFHDLDFFVQICHSNKIEDAFLSSRIYGHLNSDNDTISSLYIELILCFRAQWSPSWRCIPNINSNDQWDLTLYNNGRSIRIEVKHILSDGTSLPHEKVALNAILQILTDEIQQIIGQKQSIAIEICGLKTMLQTKFHAIDHLRRTLKTKKDSHSFKVLWKSDVDLPPGLHRKEMQTAITFPASGPSITGEEGNLVQFLLRYDRASFVTKCRDIVKDAVKRQIGLDQESIVFLLYNRGKFGQINSTEDLSKWRDYVESIHMAVCSEILNRSWASNVVRVIGASFSPRNQNAKRNSLLLTEFIIPDRLAADELQLSVNY